MIQTLPLSNCPLCPRLVAFREANAVAYPAFFNGAVPSFGSIDAELLVVGLAPGVKGANATGRPFTGDYAGDVLYPALKKYGFAKGVYDKRPDDGYELINARITNAVRCVPPENKPIGAEINSCNPFLANEIAMMPNLKVILSLGGVSHKAVIRALGLKQSNYAFGHAVEHKIPMQTYPSSPESQGDAKATYNTQIDSSKIASDTGNDEHKKHRTVMLLNSYHTSRYNINTNRLTFDMFDNVIARVATMLA